jgi:hypothetical protein
MFLPLVSDRVHPPLAVEFARLVAAANQVVKCDGEVFVKAVAAKRVARKAVGLFTDHGDYAEILIACPYTSARRDNVRRLGLIMAHEFMHAEQWSRGDPLTEPAPGRDLLAWENAMLARILGALPCGKKTLTKNRT